MSAKKIISFSKMGDAMVNQLFKAFPLGFEDKLINIFDGPDKTIKGLVWETDGATYLIKFDKMWYATDDDDDSSSVPPMDKSEESFEDADIDDIEDTSDEDIDEDMDSDEDED